jgi:hypothetical protein
LVWYGYDVPTLLKLPKVEKKGEKNKKFRDKAIKDFLTGGWLAGVDPIQI